MAVANFKVSVQPPINKLYILLEKVPNTHQTIQDDLVQLHEKVSTLETELGSVSEINATLTGIERVDGAAAGQFSLSAIREVD